MFKGNPKKIFFNTLKNYWFFPLRKEKVLISEIQSECVFAIPIFFFLRRKTEKKKENKSQFRRKKGKNIAKTGSKNKTRQKQS